MPNPNLMPAWRPGESGNHGRVARGQRRVLAYARKGSMEAIQTVMAIMLDPMTPAATRLTAAITILDRAWGKPKETITLDGEGIGTLRIEFVDPRNNGAILDASTFEVSFSEPEPEDGAL